MPTATAKATPLDPSRFHGALLGLATGDALGTTVEFKPPGSFTPMTEMTGGGPFELLVMPQEIEAVAVGLWGMAVASDGGNIA